MKSRCVVDQTGRESNIRQALARGLPVCTMEAERSNNRIAIVAAGPSVDDYADELRDFDGPVWAINGAYDHLVGRHGIVPDGFVAVDPQPQMTMHLTRPRRETVFYISSLCHPDVFDVLEGFDVRIWHSNSEETNRFLPSGSIAVPGGTTCLTRAPMLAYLQGYRDVHIYGADCSFRGDQRHVAPGQEWKVTEQDQVIQITCNGQDFDTKATLMLQASSLGAISEFFPGTLTFRCGGLLPAFLASMRPLESVIDPNEPILGLDP